MKIEKIQYNAPVTLTFTFAAFIITLIGFLTKGNLNSVFASYATSFADPMQYVRYFSYVFAHADWNHYTSNFMMILLLGPMLEEKYGWKNLIYMIIITALVGGFVNSLFFNTALIGASGIVFMMILLSSYANAKTGKIPLTLILVLVIYIGREIYSGLTVQDNISQFCHILGGLCGTFFGFYFNKKSN